MIKPTGTVRAQPSRTAAQTSSMKPARGDWNSVWYNFDRRVKAKSEAAANDGATGGDGPDMFEAAGVAAE
jgi:ribonucleoside-diphosphate reductase beta chain